MGVVAAKNLIVNPRAPVRAYRKYHLDETRDFKNLDEFERWYSPGFHGSVVGMVNSKFLFTDVLLETIEDPRRVSVVHGPVVKPRGQDHVTNGGPRRTHQVDVDGSIYGSVFKAFDALELPIDKHVKFRGQLKAAGALSFEHVGRTYNFKLVE